MRTRKEYGELAVEAAGKFSGVELTNTQLGLVHVTLLDIRDLLESIERRMGAKEIKKSAKKKKHGTS